MQEAPGSDGTLRPSRRRAFEGVMDWIMPTRSVHWPREALFAGGKPAEPAYSNWSIDRPGADKRATINSRVDLGFLSPCTAAPRSRHERRHRRGPAPRLAPVRREPPQLAGHQPERRVDRARRVRCRLLPHRPGVAVR